MTWSEWSTAGVCEQLKSAFGSRFAVLALAFVFAASALSPLAHAADIDEAREIEIGDELAVTLLEGGKLLNNDRAQEYVNQVGRWLTTGTERVDLPWQFGIMDRAEIGAYPLPGGKVLITRGMLKKLNSEAELAGVLAHEIAHIVKRHQLKTMSTEGGQDKLGAINFPLDRALEFKDAAVHDAAKYALSALLKAQFPIGAFPQGWSEPVAAHPIRKAS